MTPEKTQLRTNLLARRAAPPAAAAESLADLALATVDFTPFRTIAGVWPLAGEMDLRPLLHRLHVRGHAIALPETTPRGQPLVFRAWTPGAALLTGRFGTLHPDGASVTPDLIFVPLLAFDRHGHRMGYGGGYYDRTLAGLPGCTAIGFAASDQEVPLVPTEPHDRNLTTIITEREVIQATPP